MGMIIAGLDIRIISLVLAAAMLIAWKAGKWAGRRLTRTQDHIIKPSKFDDASMALLGLLLAFAFGMSIAKHDQRRLAIVADSNAIGDFYTCAALLKEPVRSELQNVIRQYAQLRLELTRGPLNEAVLEDALAKFGQMQSRMTQLVAQAIKDGTPIAVSLTNTLNAVASNQALRLSAFRDRLPPAIVVLLVAAAVATAFLIGREQGAAGSSDVAGTLCFILLVTLAVYVTLDLNSPKSGLVQVIQEPIERLVSSMRA